VKNVKGDISMEAIFEALLQLVFELVLDIAGGAAGATFEFVFSSDFGIFLSHHLPVPTSLSGEVIPLGIQNHKGRIS
jgi:hypothetical protein